MTTTIFIIVLLEKNLLILIILLWMKKFKQILNHLTLKFVIEPNITKYKNIFSKGYI